MQRFYGSEEPIDIEKIYVIAGFAGSTERVLYPSGNTDENWENNLVQKVLATYCGDLGNQAESSSIKWVVLYNKAKTSAVLKKIPDMDELLDREATYIRLPAIDELGCEGSFTSGEVEITWEDSAYRKRTLKFDGDNTLRKVVDVFGDWGVVTSPEWPVLLLKYPQLTSMVQYLIDKEILYSTGSHPSHPNHMVLGGESKTSASEKKIGAPNPKRSLVDLPQLDIRNGQWIKVGSKEMKEFGWGSTGSLKTKRGNGEKNDIKTAGVDDTGFGWRKETEQKVWYYVDWLRHND